MVAGWEERKRETGRSEGRGAQWGKAWEMGRRGGYWTGDVVRTARFPHPWGLEVC